MMVMIVIGLLAAVMVPKFTYLKSRAYVTAQRSDVANLALEQEEYFFLNRGYASSLDLMGIMPTSGVALVVNEATGAGWSASSSHSSTLVRCAVFYGSAAPVAPAVSAGAIACE
jgi:Tfp pilus assembly protein PilE